MMANHQQQHPLIVLMEDEILHTDSHPFCCDPACPCHEQDAESIAQVNQAVEQGLLTPAEATQLIAGKTL